MIVKTRAWDTAAALGFALALTGCGDARTPEPPSGAAIFRQACARCHGPTGAGDGPEAARLGGAPALGALRDAAQIRAIVTHGRGAMPAHDQRLSPAQIDLVVAHVLTLAR
ncbi:MAG: cytochrome c [Myxococcales bacterium]|nr:cytochrome c [Myxococcales bacterium]